MRSKKKVLIISLFIIFLFCALAYKLLYIDGITQAASPYQLSLKHTSALSDSKQQINLFPVNNQYNIVHIFTTWCGCCKKEIPELAKISASHQIIGLVWTQKPQEATAWLEQYGNYYSQIGVIGDKETIMLGVSKTPTTLVIDSNGMVQCSIVGQLTLERFNAEIVPCLK